MKIIPAIDILNGKCVRLSKGNYNKQKIYSEQPLEIAKEFEANGMQYLHLVDLDGAKSNQIINYKILEQIAIKTNLKIDFGGGLKSQKDAHIAFESGAYQIIGGSVAINNPTLFLKWLQHYGSDKVILGADCKNKKIAIQGWLKTSKVNVVDFIVQYQKKSVSNCICTDIAKDGMLQGSSTDLYIEILNKTSVNLTASGGISSIDDLHQLKKIGCKGAIIGKALYEGFIKLKELQLFLN
ncbi:MAG: 1-(5-phosphoribosyl)-5-[(5-phosphoribosylamino)methylideneamino]imidazole-4-carboxamide isomerase [Tenacibaculum sp.]